jgi:hypothetical protein
MSVDGPTIPITRVSEESFQKGKPSLPPSLTICTSEEEIVDLLFLFKKVLLIYYHHCEGAQGRNTKWFC